MTADRDTSFFLTEVYEC